MRIDEKLLADDELAKMNEERRRLAEEELIKNERKIRKSKQRLRMAEILFWIAGFLIFSIYTGLLESILPVLGMFLIFVFYGSGVLFIIHASLVIITIPTIIFYDLEKRPLERPLRHYIFIYIYFIIKLPLAFLFAHHILSQRFHFG